MNGHVLDWSKPWQHYFEETTRIPHGSYHEQPLSDWLVSFAKEQNLEYKQYPCGNVIIKAPASAGYEDHPAVVIQAHMDMVWEKTAESTHDFLTEPLKLRIEDGWLMATDTTLGADDCTGVAYMLAILADKTLPHPPLECVFTVSEETGMEGAFKMEPADLTGLRFISLDGGGEGRSTVITSAGGVKCKETIPLHRAATDREGFRLTVDGLSGGHSGICIGQEKGNAIRLCARVLNRMRECGPLFLADIAGGDKDNAIPRTCTAEFSGYALKEDLEQILREEEEKIRGELAYSDPEVRISLESCRVQWLIDPESTDRLIDFLLLVPGPVQHRSMVLDLVTASENLASVKITEEGAGISVSLRAERGSYLETMANELRMLSSLYGESHAEYGSYPSWAYEEKSALRDTFCEVMTQLTGSETVLQAVHGGLECGVFKSKWPGMEIVTFGPKAENVHTPQERLNLESFDRCFGLLCSLLERL